MSPPPSRRSRAGAAAALLALLSTCSSCSDTLKLMAPGSAAAQATSPGSINVTWGDPNSQEDGYSVERSESPASGFTVVALVAKDTRSYADLGLRAGATYYYRIQATAGSRTGPYSDTVSATTDLLPGQCAPGLKEYYGQCLHTLQLLGQSSYRQATRDTVTAASLFHAPGVVVDRISRPNHVYVADSGNNRILGFRALGHCVTQPFTECTNDTDCPSGDTCLIDPLRPADIVIGQPDARSGSCNGDVNNGLYLPPTSSTLCLMEYPRGTNVSEQWQHFNFTVDAQGGLWFPDIYNDRIVRYANPLGFFQGGGEGDGMADLVLGQLDLFSNGVNNGRGPGSPSAQSLRLSDFLTSTRGAPSVDAQGNVWVADTGNHRVLRFPLGSTTADLVLGQASFTASGATDCSPLGPTGLAMNKLCNPTIAKVEPGTGELYVFDETASAAFAGRMQVFTPPFQNGMSAARTIRPRLGGTDYTGPVYSTPGNVWKPQYEFQVSGFEFNPYRVGPYANGLLWFNEHDANRTVLISATGDVLAVIGARDFTYRGGDQQYDNGCGSIDDPPYTRGWWSSGSFGFDNANNIYLTDEMLHANHVSRFALPYVLGSAAGPTCLPDPNAAFLRPNGPGPAKISEAAGLITNGNQLIVQDQARLMVWNSYMSRSMGAPADVVVGQASATERVPNSFQMGSRSAFAIDEWNRLWTFNAHGGLMVFQLPLTSSSQPLVNYVPPGSGAGGGRVYWADDQSQITGGISGIAIDNAAHKLWLASGNRVLRVSDYRDPAQPLYVDMVLGQVDKTDLCNRGLSAPTARTLCNATRIKLDRAGNLYVVENTYECHPNDRITVFPAAGLAAATGMFPDLAATTVFNRRMTQDFAMPAQCGVGPADADRPFSPINVAFNSRNELVIGNDGYYPLPDQRAWQQLYLYRTPLTKQTPDAAIRLPIGATGDLTFDQDDHLVVQDHTWYRIWVIDLEEKAPDGSFRWR